MHSAARYLQADSSPLKGWIFFVLLEDRLFWPKSWEPTHQLEMGLTGHMLINHSLPLTTFGYGAADVAYKARAS
eukprot:2265584-Pyramimonas_sp.AAC.1